MNATIVGAALGLCLGLGLTALYAGLRGGPPSRRRQPRLPEIEHVVPRIVLALLLGAVLGLITGWPVLALAGAAAGWVLPGLAARRTRVRRRMERAVALIELTELLGDMLEGSGQGIESVLRAACEVAPRPIRAESLHLARELGGRISTADALGAFAAQMADPTSDQLVMALSLGESDQLPRVLRSLAASGRAELEVRRRVEAGRSGTLWAGRFIIGLTALVALVMVLLDHTYLAAYSTPGGQVVLLLVVLILAASVWAMERTARTPAPRRLPAHTEGER